MAYNRGISSLEFLYGHCETYTCHQTAPQGRYHAEDGCRNAPAELLYSEPGFHQCPSEEGRANGRVGPDVGVAEVGYLALHQRRPHDPSLPSHHQVNPAHISHPLPYPLSLPLSPSIQHQHTFVPDQTPHAISPPHAFPTDPSYAHRHVLHFIYQDSSPTARRPLLINARVIEGLVEHTVPGASSDDNSVELQQTLHAVPTVPALTVPVQRERRSLWGVIRERVRREFQILKETYETGPWEWDF